MNKCHIVFSPRKTGSASIARTWARKSHLPSIHTHDMLYLIVSDMENSNFYKYLKNMNIDISHENRVDCDIVEYTLIVNTKNNLDLILGYFHSIQIITSIRNPLHRRISQCIQSLTIDQVNAVIDGIGGNGELGRCEKIDTSKKVEIGKLCQVLKTIGSRATCTVIKESSKIILCEKRLLCEKDVIDIFNKNYVEFDTREFEEFFGFMYNFVIPDFDMKKVKNLGWDTQNYTILGKNVEHLIFKLENMKDKHVSGKFQYFTGIDNLSRDHNSDECQHLFKESSKDIKKKIVYLFENKPLSRTQSLEYKIAKGFGYY